MITIVEVVYLAELKWVMMDYLKKETVISPAKKFPYAYDLVIIGTPRYVDMSPAVRTYVSKYKNKIKKLACFVTAGENKHYSVVNSIKKLYGKDIFADAGFVLKDFKAKKTYNEKINNFIRRIIE